MKINIDQTNTVIIIEKEKKHNINIGEKILKRLTTWRQLQVKKELNEYMTERIRKAGKLYNILRSTSKYVNQY